MIARLGWKMSIALRLLLASVFLASSARAAALPNDCTQLIVALAPDWNSMRGQSQRYERTSGGSWEKVGGAVPGVFGKNGMAWVRGLAVRGRRGRRIKGASSGRVVA